MVKPPITWVGNKERYASCIISIFPPKLDQYGEPFSGSAAVLLALPPDPNRLDIYNDLDADLVNFFSCVKECTNVLMRELEFPKELVLNYDPENIRKLINITL